LDGQQIAQFLPLLLIVVVFWLLILRPARRRQQDAAKLQRSIGEGDKVMLTSGVFGTVRGLGDGDFELEVASGVVLTVHRQAVNQIVTKADEPAEPADAAESTERQSDDGGDARS